MIKILVLAMLLAASGDEIFEVTVKSGDTLSKIAQRYLQNPESWPELLRYNSIADPNKILPGMVLKVPSKLASETTKTEGKVAGPSVGAWKTLSATGKVEKISGKDRFPIAMGDMLEPGTRIEVGAKGTASFRLPDTSTVRMGGNSKIDIVQSEAAKEAGSFKTMVKVFGGYFSSRVAKLKPGGAYGVATPTAVAGVRGTEFSVDVDETTGISKLSVEEGKVAVVAGGKEAMVNKGEGVVTKQGEAPSKPVALLGAPIMKKSTLPDGNEALEWERPKDAAQCGFLIARDVEFTAIVKETTSMDGLGEQDLPAGDYYARAYCVDKSGLRGKLSESLDFSTE